MSQQERKPHKHAEVIKAWADGENIQYLPPGNNTWVDFPCWMYLEYHQSSSKTGISLGNSNYEWRVKPEAIPAGEVLKACSLAIKDSTRGKKYWQEIAQLFMQEIKNGNVKEQ